MSRFLRDLILKPAEVVISYMRRKPPSRYYLRIMAIVVAVASSHVYAYNDEITLFLQTLEGPTEFSVNVTTIIELQLMRTLRTSGGVIGKRAHFGKGRIFRNKEKLTINGFVDADNIAKSGNNLNPQGVLWGKCWLFADGVAVQTYLTLPSYEDYRSERNEVWKISIAGASNVYEFLVDAPSRRYELPVIIVPTPVVQKYSTPDGMPIYSDITRTTIITHLGSDGVYDFKALEHRGDFTKIRTDKAVGWLYLPALSQANTQLIDFVSGVIRMFRSDYSGALESFSNVTESSDSMYIRRDSLLFSTLAKAKLGRSCHSTAQGAVQLNPFSTTSVKYLVMCDLEELKMEKSLERRSVIASNILTTVSIYRKLFSDNDEWMASISNLFDEINNNPSLLGSLR